MGFIGQLVQDAAVAAAAAKARAAAWGVAPAPPEGMASWEAVKQAALERMLSMIARLLGAGTPGLAPLPCALMDIVRGALADATRNTLPFGTIGLFTQRTAVQVRAAGGPG